MQVGREVYACGEDTLLVLTLALAVELLPPLTHKVQLRLEVYHDLDLLTALVETIAYGSILCCGVLCEWNVLTACLLQLLGTGHKFLDVESCACDRQQTYWGEHRETSAHVVGDDEALVSLLVSACAGSTFLGVGDGHDHLLGLFLAALGLALLLQQTEGQCGLGGGTALRDVDHAELLVLQIVGELEEIVLADVVTRKEDGGVLLVGDQPGEAVAEGLDDGACSQLAAADACHDDGLAVGAQCVGAGLQFVEEGRCDTGGQVQPSEEVITGACALFQCLLGGLYFWLEGFYGAGF